MAEIKIFPMVSGDGFGAIIHGNFVTITIGFNKFYASVSAFKSDANYQHEAFDTAAEAAAWATKVAETHEGRAREISKSKIEHWELRDDGYSITINRTDSGEYGVDVFPMWVDSDHYPVLNDIEKFPTVEEALQFARQSADERERHRIRYEDTVQQIKTALEAHSG